MANLLLDQVKLKITLRHKATKTDSIYMVAQVEISYIGISVSYIRVMCDYEGKELYAEFPKFFTRGYYFWIQDKNDLENVERAILNNFQEKIKLEKPLDIPTDEIDDRVMDGKYFELASFKQITFMNRKQRKT